MPEHNARTHKELRARNPGIEAVVFSILFSVLITCNLMGDPKGRII